MLYVVTVEREPLKIVVEAPNKHIAKAEALKDPMFAKDHTLDASTVKVEQRSRYEG